MELSLRSIFQDFNASKFVVYLSVLFFTGLLALRLDNTLDISYILVFLPLWLWKLLALTGAVIGCVSHCKRPPQRNDATTEVDFRAMVLSAGEHLLLFAFEIMACYKLEVERYAGTSTNSPMWIIVFVPLLFESAIAIIICIWSVRQDKSFEFELFFAVNLLQFAFVALKRDKLIEWNWAIVFIPLWILICLSLIGVLYAIILAVLLIRSIELLPEHRRQHVYSAVGYTFLVVPILVFLASFPETGQPPGPCMLWDTSVICLNMVLITGKLDSMEMGREDEAARMPFTIVCTPLFVSLICLMLMSVGTKGGNTWWFGMRRDFCVFLLDSCPCLREYGNVSYKFGAHSRQSRGERSVGVEEGVVSVEMRPNARHSTNLVRPDLRPIFPPVSIEVPD